MSFIVLWCPLSLTDVFHHLLQSKTCMRHAFMNVSISHLLQTHTACRDWHAYTVAGHSHRYIDCLIKWTTGVPLLKMILKENCGHYIFHTIGSCQPYCILFMALTKLCGTPACNFSMAAVQKPSRQQPCKTVAGVRRQPIVSFPATFRTDSWTVTELVRHVEDFFFRNGISKFAHNINAPCPMLSQYAVNINISTVIPPQHLYHFSSCLSIMWSS